MQVWKWLRRLIVLAIAIGLIIAGMQIWLKHLRDSAAAAARVPPPAPVKFVLGDRNTNCDMGNEGNLVYLRMATQRLVIPCRAFTQSMYMAPDGSYTQVEIHAYQMLDGALLDNFEITRPYAWTSDGTYQIQFGVPTDTPSKWRFSDKELDMQDFQEIRNGVYAKYETPYRAFVALDVFDTRNNRVTLYCTNLPNDAHAKPPVPELPFDTCTTYFAIRKDLLIWIQTGRMSPTFLRGLPGSFVKLQEKINHYIVSDSKED